MWRTVKCNAGSVDMQFKGANTNNAEDSVAIIDYGDRKGGSVTLDWNRRSMLNFAMPFYLSGGLLAILAVLSASVFAMPPHKRRNKRAFAMVDGIGSTQGDDDEVAAWVKNAEASAARSEKSGPKRKRRVMLGIARVVRKIAKTKLRSLRLSILARAISLPISRTLPLMVLKKTTISNRLP